MRLGKSEKRKYRVGKELRRSWGVGYVGIVVEGTECKLVN